VWLPFKLVTLHPSGSWSIGQFFRFSVQRCGLLVFKLNVSLEAGRKEPRAHSSVERPCTTPTWSTMKASRLSSWLHSRDRAKARGAMLGYHDFLGAAAARGMRNEAGFWKQRHSQLEGRTDSKLVNCELDERNQGVFKIFLRRLVVSINNPLGAPCTMSQPTKIRVPSTVPNLKSHLASLRLFQHKATWRR